MVSLMVSLMLSLASACGDPWQPPGSAPGEASASPGAEPAPKAPGQATGGQPPAPDEPGSTQTPDADPQAGPSPRPAEPSMASGLRGSCGFPDPTQTKQDLGPCQPRTLPGTGHAYCVKAHPDCADPGERCPLLITFNMGSNHGLSATFSNRVNEPHRYGKLVVVGGGTSADVDVMAELPRQIMADLPGVDPLRIYALGNSRGAGAIQAITRGDDSPYGSTSDLYAAAAVFGGRLKPASTYKPSRGFHLLIVNGQRDVPEPDGLRELAKLHGCQDADSPWRDVLSSDPLVPGATGTDAAQRLTFGACPGGDLIAYRFKDEGHVTDFQRHFDPKVRAIMMAWDFFQGRSRDAHGLVGLGSACWRDE